MSTSSSAATPPKRMLMSRVLSRDTGSPLREPDEQRSDADVRRDDREHNGGSDDGPPLDERDLFLADLDQASRSEHQEQDQDDCGVDADEREEEVRTLE